MGLSLQSGKSAPDYRRPARPALSRRGRGAAESTAGRQKAAGFASASPPRQCQEMSGFVMILNPAVGGWRAGFEGRFRLFSGLAFIMPVSSDTGGRRSEPMTGPSPFAAPVKAGPGDGGALFLMGPDPATPILSRRLNGL